MDGPRSHYKTVYQEGEEKANQNTPPMLGSRTGVRGRRKLVGCRQFVTTFPCHYCVRHFVAADSKAIKLHRDAITAESLGWQPPSEGGTKVLFRPFYGVAPRFYERAFFKDRELKEKQTGDMKILEPEWASPWYLSQTSYVQIEAKLSKTDSPHAPADENSRSDSPAPASPHDS